MTTISIDWDRVSSIDELKQLFKVILDVSEPITVEEEKAAKLLKTGFFKKAS